MVAHASYSGWSGGNSSPQHSSMFFLKNLEDLLDLASEGLSARGAWEPGTHLTFGDPF